MSWWTGLPVAHGLALGAAVAGPVAFLAWRRGALTASGSGLAAVVGAVTVGFGGPALGLAVIAFFLTSVGLGRLSGGPSRPAARDGWQVAANGGAAAVFAVAGHVYAEPTLLLAAFGAVAGATADTWASEVGAATGGRTWRLLPPGEVTPGANGGVSIAGIAASGLGASLVAAIALLALPPAAGLAVLAGGTGGALLDSLLGGWLEPRAGHAGLAFYDSNLNNALTTALAGLLAACLVALR